MLRTIVTWTLAVVVTLSAAVYQRLTGPTYPLRGELQIAGQPLPFKLPRSFGGPGGPEIALELPGFDGEATLSYRRYKVGEPMTRVPMQREGDRISATLPHQPPAGKLEYFVELRDASGTTAAPAGRTAVIRFKGAVPAAFLIPHVLFMFIAMLLSNRAGLEALLGGPRLARYALLATVALLLGGMVLGPVVQKYAFGAFWTGVPFGFDLTDNKTLLAMIGWTLALWQAAWRRTPSARWWVLSAAVLLLLIYSVPHSMLGSELDYTSGQVVTGD